MTNHLTGLSNQLRSLARLDETPEADQLRAAALVLERQPCEHESDNHLIKGVRIGRCRHCQTPMKLAWVVDDQPDLDADPDELES